MTAEVLPQATIPHAAPPRALLIGGFDPSAGAGVLLDAFVAARLGFQPAAVATTVTAQNSSTWLGAEAVSATTVAAQLTALADEGPFACVKIGALGNSDNVEAVAKFLRAAPQSAVVLDPVVTSSSGGMLAEPAVVDAMRTHLFELVDLITPNAAEALLLAPEAPSPERAASHLAEHHTTAVLVTGLPGTPGTAADLLAVRGKPTRLLTHAHLDAVGDPRGTGCAFSTTIACRLAAFVAPPSAETLRDQGVFESAVTTSQGDLLRVLGGAVQIGNGRAQADLRR